MTLSEAIGARVQQRRKKRGWTMRILGGKVGIDDGQISRLEKGQNAWRVETLHWVCTALDVSMSRLLEGIEHDLG